MLFSAKRSYKIWLKDWQGITDLQGTAHVLQTMRASRKLIPVPCLSLPQQRLLIIAPHPDDEAIGCGGALLFRAKASGAKASGKNDCRLLVLTKGRQGKSETWQEETKAVCKRIHADPCFLNYEAGKIPLDSESFMSAIHSFNPQILLLPSLLDDHDDHRRVSHMILNAVSQGAWARKPEIWAYQVYSCVPGNVIIDITEVIAAKKSLINLYEEEMKRRDWAHFSCGQNAYMSRFLPEGGSRCYAEMYFVAPFDDYVALCKLYFHDPAQCYYQDIYKSMRL